MAKLAPSPADRLNTLIKKSKREALERTLDHQIKSLQLTIPVEREYVFHPTRKWRFDFAIPELRIAIEVEGGTFSGKDTRHTTGMGHHEDCNKYNAAAMLGWRVLRYTAKHIASGQAYDELEIYLKPYSGCAIVSVGGES